MQLATGRQLTGCSSLWCFNSKIIRLDGSNLCSISTFLVITAWKLPSRQSLSAQNWQVEIFWKIFTNITLNNSTEHEIFLFSLMLIFYRYFVFEKWLCNGTKWCNLNPMSIITFWSAFYMNQIECHISCNQCWYL